MIIDFEKPYNRLEYLYFLQNHFLPDDFESVSEKIDILQSTKYIQEVNLLGVCDSLDLKIYEIEHQSENDPRVSLSKETFRIMTNYGSRRALVLFVSTNSPNYRFSLVTLDLELEGKQVLKKYSNPRRYSFFLGPDCRKHTPQEYLIQKGRISDLDDLKNRFSIEVVNKDFYKKIALAFTELVGGKRKVGSRIKEFEPLLRLPGTPPSNHQKYQEFAVRLIGRLLFIWFLKKKRSIKNDIPLVPDRLIAKEAVSNNFYHDTLEKLFFQVLNTPITDRLEEYKIELWTNIPFLNGGLFEPNREDYYDTDPILNISKHVNTLIIPDSWFEKLFDIFETYNFTIDENTSIDIELSIEPEMLGRIFENLLAEINPETGETARKNTGSYYTPRPIVEYMVDESLKQYLLTNTEISEEKIVSLLDYSDESDTLTDSEKGIVINVLDDIKVLDPACGSGAFPMGLLQKMLLILQKVDPESMVWLIKQLERIPDVTLRKEVEDKLFNENWNYIHKLGIIQNSIYGIDIQPIAVEISKLRFFLSLVVDGKIDDKKENRGLKPLPNLEFKFVCANSLIGLPETENTQSQEALFKDTFFNDFNREVQNYFNASEPKEKHNVRGKIEALIDKKTQEKFDQIQSVNNQITADPRRLREREQETERLTQLMTLWGSYKNLFKNEPVGFFDIQYFFPECKDGFDVVIGNPPYISYYSRQAQKITAEYMASLKNNYDFITNKNIKGRYHSVMFFLERSIKLLSNSAVNIFIIDISFFELPFKNIRKYLFEKSKVIEIIKNLNEFEKVASGQLILSFQKSIQEDYNVEIRNELFGTGDIVSKKEILSNDNYELEFLDKRINMVQTKVENHCEELGGMTNVRVGVNIGGVRSYFMKTEAHFHKFINGGDNVKKYVINYPSLKQQRTGEMYFDFNKKVELNIWRNKIGTPSIGESNDRFLQSKLIIRQSDITITATYDDEGYHCDYNLFTVNKQNKDYSLKYILTLLNSQLFTFYSLTKGFIKVKPGKTPQIRVTDIKKLPIKKINPKGQQPLINLADQILTAKKANLQADTSALEREIDLLVYELYGLTEEEIAFVEESTR